MALTYDQISAITEKKFLPKLVDNIFDSNPALQRLRKNQEKVSGGTSVIVPLNYAQVSSAGWYSGSDTLNTADNDVITAAEYDWKQLYVNISITRKDELMNMGDAAKLNFVKSKMEIAEKTLSDALGTGVFSSGSNSKSIQGTGLMMSTSNTYGGISQSSYSWWQANVDSSTTTLSLSAMQSQFGAASIGSDTPTVGYCTQAVYDSYYALLQPQQRFMDEKTAKGGFTSLMFNGKPIIVDSHQKTGDLEFINEKYFKLYVHKDEDFRMEPFQKPINQNVKVAKVFWMGVLASSNNRMHAALNALTG